MNPSSKSPDHTLFIVFVRGYNFRQRSQKTKEPDSKPSAWSCEPLIFWRATDVRSTRIISYHEPRTRYSWQLVVGTNQKYSIQMLLPLPEREVRLHSPAAHASLTTRKARRTGLGSFSMIFSAESRLVGCFENVEHGETRTEKTWHKDGNGSRRNEPTGKVGWTERSFVLELSNRARTC